MINLIAFELSQFREFYVIFSFIIITLKFELFIYLNYHGFQLKKAGPFSSRIFFALSLLFLGDAFAYLSIMAGRFFPHNYEWLYKYFYNQTWIFWAIGAIGFAFLIEKQYQKTFQTRYMLTLIGIFITASNFFFIDTIYFKITTLSLLVLSQIFFLIFEIFILRKSSGRNRIKIGCMIGASLMFFIGQICDTDFAESFIYSEYFYLLKYPIEFTGALLLLICLLFLPVFNEVDFRENLEELYIISTSDREILYYYNFHSATHSNVQINQLFLQGIIGLKSIIAEISQSEEETSINIIEQDESTYIIEYTKNFVSVMSVRHLFRIHREFLHKICTIFQANYGFLIESCQLNCPQGSIFNGFAALIQKELYA